MFEIREQTQAWVMDRHVTWATVRHNGEGLPRPDDWPYEHWCRMRLRGFSIQLENGLWLSTQFGEGNYCANYEMYGSPNADGEHFLERCPTAELGCRWDCNGLDDSLLEWPNGDTVLGWFSAECWWELVGRLSRLPTGSKLLDDPAIVEMVSA